MATNTTFDTLKQDVQRYLERGSSLAADQTFYEQLPRLINLAERRIARELKVEGQLNVVTTSFASGVSVYAKPDRWRETVSINFGTGTSNNTRTPLFARSYEYCRAFWPDATQTEQPQFYADYDYSHWLIAPTPDAAYPVEVLYWQLLPLLDNENQTNWLTEYAPQTLLYGTLLECQPFLKNDDRIQTWQSLYDRSAAMLNGEDLAKILDRAAVRKGD